MGKKAPLTVSKRAKIVGLHEVGLSEREIGKKVHVSKRAVPQAISKFNISGKYTDLKRSGRSRKTTACDDHVIQRMVVRSPTTSCNKVILSLAEKDSYVSRNTISRHLMKDFALLSYKATRKSRLTTSMKKKRLTFAQNHKNWTVQLWSTVLFSNESSVQQFSACARIVRRQWVKDMRKDTRLQLSNILQDR
jgi:transposase